MGHKQPSSSPPQAGQDKTLTIEEALQRAHAHWSAGQAPQAEMLCQRVLSAWPGQADALHLLGVMAQAFGNLDLGVQYLRQACLAPRTPAIYFSNLAEMCRQKGLLEEAEQAARRATALQPDLVPAWNNLGIVLQEAGKLEESAICLERVTALQPDNPEAHNNLGNTYLRMGRLDRARLMYDKALSLHPGYGEAYSNRAPTCCMRSAATTRRRRRGRRLPFIRSWPTPISTSPRSRCRASAMPRLSTGSTCC